MTMAGVGFIGICEIKAYAEYMDLTKREKEYFLPSITQMDIIYVNNVMKNKSEQGGKTVDGTKI